MWAWLVIGGFLFIAIVGSLTPSPDEEASVDTTDTTIVEVAAVTTPEAEGPATEDTDAPATEAPATKAPATEAPATEAPATPPPTTTAPASTTEPKPEADASAQLACGHFRNVINDAAAGILTDAELREKFKEVYDDAKISENEGIADGAEAILAAATNGSLTEEDLLFFSNACAAVGQ